MSELKRVVYTGPMLSLIGKTALQRHDGKVQLDGNDEWRKPPQMHNALCYGWHAIDGEWVDEQS